MGKHRRELDMPSDALQSDMAAEKLRTDIMSGVLRPGLQLKMRELLPRYEIGASPMREALARLVAEGFVEQRAQRGVRVPSMTSNELEDLSKSRETVESEVIKLAAQHGDASWEDEVVASFHVYERALLDSMRDAVDWAATESRHHRFHRALVAGCPFPTLRSICDVIHQRLTRYRVQMNRYPFNPGDVIAEHRLLMDAALSRDPDRVTSAARSHFGITPAVLRSHVVAAKENGVVIEHALPVAVRGAMSPRARKAKQDLSPK